MKKIVSVVVLVLVSFLMFSGCGKGDKAKVADQIKKFNEFMKTDEYKQIMNDPAACGKKAEEFAKNVGFKDYGDFLKAKMNVMNDPEIMKLDKEQMEMNEKIKAEAAEKTDEKAAKK